MPYFSWKKNRASVLKMEAEELFETSSRVCQLQDRVPEDTSL